MCDEVKKRSIKFTGCWTCKSRKVRCDERPSACETCERRGLVCGGYDIKLLWPSDPFANSTTSSGQGRRQIKLDRTNDLRYRMEEIDSFLLTLDNDSQAKLSMRRGPFSTFPVLTGGIDNPRTSGISSQGYSVIPLHSEEIQGIEHPDKYTFPANLDDSYIHMIKPSNRNPTPVLPLTLSSDGYLNDVTTEIFDAADIPAISSAAYEWTMDDHHTSPNIVADDDQFDSLTLYPCHRSDVSDPSTAIMKTTTPVTIDIVRLPIQHIKTSTLSKDSDIDMLMHHYIVNVADILQPVRYLHNTYRDMYVPTALEGALVPQSNPKSTSKRAHSALFHALLASAAFHLWNCDKAQTKFKVLGTQHRYRALHLLQAAVNPTSIGVNYRTILMAMLALITIGLMSGEVEDFAVHLNGAMQLRNSRRHWKIVGGSTRQLNEISAFLTLLARTLSFKTSASSWISTADEIFYSEETIAEMNPSGSCYIYMYGITTNIAAAIQETCQLAESLAQLDFNQSQYSRLALFEECEALGDRLLSWRLESEKSASTLAGDDTMSSIFKHHAHAWHCAALIYYYQRIQSYDVADVAEHAEYVIKHMNAIEGLKAKTDCEITKRMAPITWPMFVASCSSLRSRRELYREWWENVQHYGIANIRRQWDVVQLIWAKADEMDQENSGGSNWIDAYCSLGISLLPI